MVPWDDDSGPLGSTTIRSYPFTDVLFNQELMTEELPYAELQVNSITLTQFILEGILPVRPGQDATKNDVTDEMWGLLLKCWSTRPESRPSVGEVIREVQALRYVLPVVVHPTIRSLNKALSVEHRQLWFDGRSRTKPDRRFSF